MPTHLLCRILKTITIQSRIYLHNDRKVRNTCDNGRSCHLSCIM